MNKEFTRNWFVSANKFCLILILMVLYALVLGRINSNAAGGVITSAKCVLSDAATISYTAKLSGTPTADDGLVYLYQLKTYEYAIPVGAAPIATAPAASNVTMSFPLGGREAGGRLYAKYALASKQGGAMVMLGAPQYISNPELIAVATHRQERPVKTTQGEELTNLFINGSGEANMPTGFCKRTIQVLCKGGNAVTNPKAGAADMFPVTPNYYMLNAATDSGIEGLVRDMTNYATNGAGQDFIIGNEVNERMWNYMAWTGWDDYMREYAQAFRVCYTAIKSCNADARVYISLDQNWNRNRPASHAEYYSYIDGADFLDSFASIINAGGNIDWDLAIHPYTVPLTYAKFWDMSGTPDGAYCAKQIKNNSMMSFQNMSVVSAYMAKPAMKNRSGKVRDIIINEFGVSLAQGEDVQAATLCAAYYAFSKNPSITQFMYLGNSGYGVNSTLSPKAKAAYDAMGTGQEAAQMKWAAGYIGVGNLGQVVR